MNKRSCFVLQNLMVCFSKCFVLQNMNKRKCLVLFCENMNKRSCFILQCFSKISTNVNVLFCNFFKFLYTNNNSKERVHAFENGNTKFLYTNNMNYIYHGIFFNFFCEFPLEYEPSYNSGEAPIIKSLRKIFLNLKKVKDFEESCTKLIINTHRKITETFYQFVSPMNELLLLMSV